MQRPAVLHICRAFIGRRRSQGKHLRSALLNVAIVRTLAIAENAGGRTLFAHAVHQRARAFCRHCGFEQSSVAPMTLMFRRPEPGKSER